MDNDDKLIGIKDLKEFINKAIYSEENRFFLREQIDGMCALRDKIFNYLDGGDAPVVDTDLTNFCDKLYKFAYERGFSEGRKKHE